MAYVHNNSKYPSIIYMYVYIQSTAFYGRRHVGINLQPNCDPYGTRDRFQSTLTTSEALNNDITW